MKIRVIYRFLPIRWTWIGGITIYPFICFKRSKGEVEDYTFRHELEHIYQVQELGWIRFYLTYLWESLRHGYRRNKFEVAARDIEDTPLDKYERNLKDNS